MPEVEEKEKESKAGGAATAKASPQEAELVQLEKRLKDADAKGEPTGMCVFAAGKRATATETTEVQCVMLGGEWRAVAAGAEQAKDAGEQSKVDASLAALQTKLTGAEATNEKELGVCVYPAGSKACSGLMLQLQCELLGGVWFRGKPEEQAAPAK